MKKHLLTLSAVIALVGCNGGKNKTNVELIQNMMDQVSVKSQDWDPRQGEKVQMRVPPEGTVSKEMAPYPYHLNPIAAENNLKNPLTASPEVLARGQKYYNIYCAVCHGDQGAGNGTVAEKMMVKPPSLLTDKVRNFKDGRIFHIITDGQGVMSSYLSQLEDYKEEKRWAIVLYIRGLQKKGEVKP